MTEPTRPCGTCGMPCTPGEYHPYAACLMFKACHNSETVRANLEAVRATPPAVAGEPVAKLWLWKNFVGGKPEYWAFDNPFPCVSAGGDPLTLGEPCGWALFKPSVNGRPQHSEQEVVNTVYRLHATQHPTQPQAGAVPLTKEQRSRIVLTADTVSEAIDMVERHHGIKGGQHG